MSEVSEEQNYNQLMQELALNQHLTTLEQNPPQDLFPFAEEIPQSLNYNLESKNRIVKQIPNNGNNDIPVYRCFYYQLFKLCFELQDEQRSKDYLQITKQFIFDPSLIENEELIQPLKHLAEFFIMMEQEECPSFEQILSEYHEIDEAILTLFTNIVTSQSQMSHPDNRIETILNQLSEYFETTVIANHPYYKFEESDLYLFVENQHKFFLIYNESEQSEAEESHFSGSEDTLSKQEISSISKEENKSVDSKSLDRLSLDKPPSHQESVNSVYITNEEVKRPESSKSANSGYFQEYPQESKNNAADPYTQPNKYQYDHQNFKKGTDRVSSPYELSSQKNSYSQPLSYYSPPTKDIQVSYQQQLKESNYASNSHYQAQRNSTTQLNTSRNDTIINMFGDMLKSGKFQTSVTQQPKSKKHLDQNEKILDQHSKILQDQNQTVEHNSDIYPNFNKKIKDSNGLDRAKSVQSVNEHEENNSQSIVHSKLQPNLERNSQGSPFSQLQKEFQMKNYSELEVQKSEFVAKEQTRSIKQQQSKFSDNKETPIVNFDDDDSIFYKPKKSLNTINEVTASKETITQRNSDKLEDTKGSIYRQFSDTRILKLLKEPHKTKVQLMRNRFKGQHFNL